MPRRRIVAALAALGMLASLAVTAAPAGAASNPGYNINATPRINGSICDISPHTATCMNRVIGALDAARADMGLRPYSLPSRFGSLTAQEKILILANQDRIAYGLRRITGMNALLNRNAHWGVLSQADPFPVNSLGGRRYTKWTSNWAGGYGSIQNPLTAYYDWMYLDGMGRDGLSWNINCVAGNQTGCWRHRDNTLMTMVPNQQLAIGIGEGADGHGTYGWTELFQAQPASAPVAYVPSVVRMSSYSSSVHGRKVISLGGFGMVRVRAVTVLGHRARIVSRSPWSTTIVVPPHAKASGNVVVWAAGGHSVRTYANHFSYLR